jgi:hypothetical protein
MDTALACLSEDDLMGVPAFTDLCSGETWLTVEVCVRSDTPQAAQLREVCDEMFRRGLPVYVSVSKRGTPFKAG